MTCTKYSNFDRTDKNYRDLAKAIKDRRIVLEEGEGKVLISRAEADFTLPPGMRNYLRKNGYEVFYFDFPDVQMNLSEENPFERRVRDLVDKALEGTGVDLLSLHYGNEESPAGPVLLNFESRDGLPIPQLELGLAFENGTQQRGLAMSIRDYVMQQKRR